MTQSEAIAVAKQLHGENVLVVRKPLEGTASCNWKFHSSFLGELFTPGGEASWWIFRYPKDNLAKSFFHAQKALQQVSHE